MRSRRRPAFSLIELLIAMAIIAVIAGLTLSLLSSGRESVEDLKIAQMMRNGVYPLKDFKVERLPNSIFRVTWKTPEHILQVRYLTFDAQGEFIDIPPPTPAPHHPEGSTPASNP